MASITSLTFDKPAYNPGDTITLTVDYVPDTAGVNPVTSTATVNVTDANGNVTASDSAPFTVNEPVAGGDTVSVTDSGGRTWTQQSNSGTVAVFTATA
jgi:hypothetical protein